MFLRLLLEVLIRLFLLGAGDPFPTLLLVLAHSDEHDASAQEVWRDLQHQPRYSGHLHAGEFCRRIHAAHQNGTRNHEEGGF